MFGNFHTSVWPGLYFFQSPELFWRKSDLHQTHSYSVHKTEWVTMHVFSCPINAVRRERKLSEMRSRLNKLTWDEKNPNLQQDWLGFNIICTKILNICLVLVIPTHTRHKQYIPKSKGMVELVPRHNYYKTCKMLPCHLSGSKLKTIYVVPLLSSLWSKS